LVPHLVMGAAHCYGTQVGSGEGGVAHRRGVAHEACCSASHR